MNYHDQMLFEKGVMAGELFSAVGVDGLAAGLAAMQYTPEEVKRALDEAGSIEACGMTYQDAINSILADPDSFAAEFGLTSAEIGTGLAVIRKQDCSSQASRREE